MILNETTLDHFQFITTHNNQFFTSNNNEIFNYSNSFQLINTIKLSHPIKSFQFHKDKVIVHHTNNLITVYDTTFTQTIGKIKNVSTFYINSNILICLTNVIRLINLQQNRLKLIKDIPISSQYSTISSLSNTLILADATSYKLLHINTLLETPLFNINTIDETNSTNLPPIIKPLNNEEFILVVGTSPSEPSIGLIMNTKGEVSNKGSISMELYPDSIEVIDDRIIVKTGVMIKTYDLALGKEEEVSVVEDGFHLVKMEEMLLHLQDDEMYRIIHKRGLINEVEKDVETILTSSLMLYNGIKLKFISFTSSIVELSQRFNDIWEGDFQHEELINELISIETNNELNCLKFELLNNFISLLYLKCDFPSDFINDNFMNGLIDQRLFIYIMGFTIYDELYYLNGLIPFVESIRKNINKTKREFFNKFIQNWIDKIELVTDESIIKTIYLTQLELGNELNVERIYQYDEVFKLIHDPLTLSKIYKLRKDYTKVYEIYKEMINEDNSDELTLDVIHMYEDGLEINDEMIEWILRWNDELSIYLLRNQLINVNTLLKLNLKTIEKYLMMLNDEKLRSQLVKNLYKSI